MSTMFPGMDPYLEHPQVWPDVHASFIVYLREHLRPLLGPRYIIAIAIRVFVEGPTTDHPIIPDASVTPIRPEISGEIVGFDHGVGHSLLLLYDAKTPRGKNINDFNEL